MTNKIPTFNISAEAIFKTKRELNAFKTLLKLNGSNSMVIDSKDGKTFCRNKQPLIKYDKNFKLVNIHTEKEKTK
tara:strand:+ start:123 stop:347 length:225 start_codon:yes stop_codon:yes gene_type:complete